MLDFKKVAKLFKTQSRAMVMSGWALIFGLFAAPSVAQEQSDIAGIIPIIHWLLEDEPPAGQQPPTVAFAIPSNNQTYTVGDSVVVEVTASDADGTIDRVELFLDGSQTPIRTEFNPPYTWNDTTRGSADPVLNQLTVGTHQLRAVAYDNDGLIAQLTISVVIQASPVNQAPTVSFAAPANNASFTESQSVLVTANASDSDGQVSRVELRVDGGAAQIDQSAPYQWTLSGLSIGSHTLQLIAVDDDGAASMPANRSITVTADPVNPPPTVNFTAPNNNQTFTEGDTVNVSVSASDNGSVVRVDLYVDGIFESSDTSAPYNWSLSNLGLGSHTLRAVAVDDGALENESSISITVNEQVNPPGDSLSKGRAVKNILARLTNGVSPAEQNHNNFANWSVVTETNASVNVAGDGSSVTFSRDVFNNGANARAYIEFTIGEVWSDDDLSVCFQVQNFAEDASGSRAGALEVVSNQLSGSKTRTVTQNGIYCTVLTVDSTINSAVIRLGLGVTDNDTRTNELTISRFSASPTPDGLPNEFVFVDQRRQAPSRAGISGAAFNYDKQVNYNATSGLTSFSVPASVNTGPSASHVLAITDSFGGFFFGGVWYPFYGLDSTNTTPNYVMTMNNQAGRSLADTNPDTDSLLDTMLAEAIAKNANDGAPGICWLAQGVNDFVVESNTASETLDNLQAHIDWCQDNDMFPVLVTAGPFNGFQNVWTPTLEAARTSYNSQVRSLVSNSSGQIALVDYDLLLDADRNGILDSALSLDGLHPNADGMAVLSEEADSVFNQIIDNVGDSNTAVNAVINPSRTECASPCTVVFSADGSTAQGLTDDTIWSQLSYYWDFDTDESDTYGSLYDQTYTYVPGDTSHEKGHVPMATKTFLCETGTCVYNVGLRAQNVAGEFDDAFVSITVNAESTQWSAANTICVSNSLNTGSDWTGFDKPCPAGATKQATFPLPDQLDGKLVLLRRGDVFDSDDMRYSTNVDTRGTPDTSDDVHFFHNRWYVQIGQSNFKVANFGNAAEAFPHLKGSINTNIASYTISGSVNQKDINTIDTTISDADVDANGWSHNVYFQGLKMVGFNFPESFQHMGLHDIDMDAENSAFHDGSIGFSGGTRCTDHPDFLDCSKIPFPKGGYISKVDVVGTPLSEINRDSTLNVAGIGCTMVNFTGIVDSRFRKSGEHNLRVMGWYRFNIMRSAFLGQHYTTNKAKLTTRICADSALFQGQYLTRNDLPTQWQDDIEGRTRADTYTGTDDDYLHVSRYMVVNGNQLGDRDIFAINQNGASFGVGIHHSNPDDNIFAQRYIVSHNIVETESNDTTPSRIDLSGTHGTCVANDYRFGTSCSAWHANVVPYHLSIDPTPITAPAKPGS